jgi:hypothetical protein
VIKDEWKIANKKNAKSKLTSMQVAKDKLNELDDAPLIKSQQ